MWAVLAPALVVLTVVAVLAGIGRDPRITLGVADEQLQVELGRGRAHEALVVELRRPRQTTLRGSSFWPVGPTWISVPISGQTPQS